MSTQLFTNGKLKKFFNTQKMLATSIDA